MDRESNRVSTYQSWRVSDRHYRDEHKTTGRDKLSPDCSDESTNARHKPEYTLSPCLPRDVRRRVSHDCRQSALRHSAPSPRVEPRVAATGAPSQHSPTSARCDAARTDPGFCFAW